MELKDTIAGMTSPDYKERFKAEYNQVKISHDKLKALLNKWDDWKVRCALEIEPTETLEQALGFNPSCSYKILHEQLTVMEQYLHCLEARAEIECIDLER